MKKMTNLEYIKSCSTHELASFIYDLIYEKGFEDYIDVDYENQNSLWGCQSKEDLIEIWLGREKEDTEMDKRQKEEIVDVLRDDIVF